MNILLYYINDSILILLNQYFFLQIDILEQKKEEEIFNI
jgi:hypothetical protein